MIINVVFITDTNYALATAAACNSIIKSKRPGSSVKIHVLAVGLSETTKSFISELRDVNVEILVIEANNDLQHLAQAHPHVSPAALLKFYLPSLFHDLDRILYLDGDIICLSDLSDLYQTLLGDHYAAVVKDMAAMVDEDHHTKIGHTAYFNSGMMLLNLSKMRRDKVSERLIELKSKKTYQHFMDQDEFNAVLGRNVVLLPPSSNLMERNFRHSIVETARFYETECGELQAMLDSPLLKHLTNSPKVWCNPKDDNFELWFRFLPASLIKHYIWFLNDLLSQRAREAETRATHSRALASSAERFAQHAKSLVQEAELSAQQAKAKAQQAEQRAHRAESALHEHAAQLTAVFKSRSWRLTAPLRWVAQQGRSLLQNGLKSRFKALAMKIFRTIGEEVLKRQGLRRWLVTAAHRMGIYRHMKRLHSRVFGGAPRSVSKVQTVVSELSPHARQIHSRLRAASSNQNHEGL